MLKQLKNFLFITRNMVIVNIEKSSSIFYDSLQLVSNSSNDTYHTKTPTTWINFFSKDND